MAPPTPDNRGLLEAATRDILRLAENRRMSWDGNKYAFLDKDNLKEAEEELLDLINYSIFAIIRLRMLREKQ